VKISSMCSSDAHHEISLSTVISNGFCSHFQGTYEILRTFSKKDTQLQELHDFLNAGLRRPFRAVLELLESVIPKGNEQVMEWIVFILDKGTEEEQGIALDRLSDSQQVCDINATVNLILNRLFCLMDDSKWFDMSESGEKFLMKGLAAVARLSPICWSVSGHLDPEHHGFRWAYFSECM